MARFKDIVKKNPENPREVNGILMVENTVSSLDADRFSGRHSDLKGDPLRT